MLFERAADCCIDVCLSVLALMAVCRFFDYGDVELQGGVWQGGGGGYHISHSTETEQVAPPLPPHVVVCMLILTHPSASKGFMKRMWIIYCF